MYIHNMLAQNISTKAQRIEIYYIISFWKSWCVFGIFVSRHFLLGALVGGFWSFINTKNFNHVREWFGAFLVAFFPRKRWIFHSAPPLHESIIQYHSHRPEDFWTHIRQVSTMMLKTKTKPCWFIMGSSLKDSGWISSSAARKGGSDFLTNTETMRR